MIGMKTMCRRWYKVPIRHNCLSEMRGKAPLPRRTFGMGVGGLECLNIIFESAKHEGKCLM